MEVLNIAGQLPIKTWCDDIDPGTLEQINNLARHPVVKLWPALMPDAHVGYGMPIGGVVACENAVIPNAVGVDIGCGVAAMKTTVSVKKLDKVLLKQILDEVKTRVPVGFKHHDDPQSWVGFRQYEQQPKTSASSWMTPESWAHAQRSLGTMGGNNHFIELQADKEDNLWVMIHSGSRKLGLDIAKAYYELALDLNTKYHSPLPDKDLAFLSMDTREGANYLYDMEFACEFARVSRYRMMTEVYLALDKVLGNVSHSRRYDVVHNFVKLENHYKKNYFIHRKGATPAYAGDICIIPGSSGELSRSYMMWGKGDAQSFKSCSHGAGRTMGRNQARDNLTQKMVDMAVGNVVVAGGSLDRGEAPQAYKDIDDVLKAQLDLVSVMVELRPLAVLKAPPRAIGNKQKVAAKDPIPQSKQQEIAS